MVSSEAGWKTRKRPGFRVNDCPGLCMCFCKWSLSSLQRLRRLWAEEQVLGNFYCGEVVSPGVPLDEVPERKGHGSPSRPYS